MQSNESVSSVTYVDKNEGIFLVEAQTKGGAHPIHVQAKTFGNSMKLKCSSQKCSDAIGPMSRDICVAVTSSDLHNVQTTHYRYVCIYHAVTCSS